MAMVDGQPLTSARFRRSCFYVRGPRGVRRGAAAAATDRRGAAAAATDREWTVSAGRGANAAANAALAGRSGRRRVHLADAHAARADHVRHGHVHGHGLQEGSGRARRRRPPETTGPRVVRRHRRGRVSRARDISYRGFLYRWSRRRRGRDADIPRERRDARRGYSERATRRPQATRSSAAASRAARNDASRSPRLWSSARI